MNPWSGLLVVFFSPLFVHASDNRFDDADRNLNAVYKACLVRLNPPQQEILRRAERAWIPYTDKQEAILQSLKRQHQLTDDQVDQANLAMVYARTNHLAKFFGSVLREGASKDDWTEQERRLTRAYAQSMQALNPSQQMLLRKAERAWIVYRDADVLAVSVFNSQAARYAASAELAEQQTNQLNYLAGSSLAVSTAVSAPAIDPSEAAETAKAVIVWKADAATALQNFEKQTTDPFFAQTVSLKEPHDLSSELVAKLSDLKAQANHLATQSHDSSLREPAKAELAAVNLLQAWHDLMTNLTTDDADDAGKTFEDLLKEKPAGHDYAIIWQAAEKWNAAYMQETTAFKAHVAKADSFAELGKDAEAIREYQAALDIIESPAIAKKVKQIRDQSLGL